MREEVPPVLQYQILQLALDLPASKFSWFRIQVSSFYSPCAVTLSSRTPNMIRFVSTMFYAASLFSSQDVADTESGEKSVLYLLLKMFVSSSGSSSSSHLKTSTQMLVLKVRSVTLLCRLSYLCFKPLQSVR